MDNVSIIWGDGEIFDLLINFGNSL